MLASSKGKVRPERASWGGSFVSIYRSTGTFLDSSVLLNLLFETELTERARKILSMADDPLVSETVVDECVYVTLRKKASSRGIKSIHELRKFLKTEEGRSLLRESSEMVLSFIGRHGIEIVEDPPDIFLTLSIAEKYGLLMHDAKIVGAMIVTRGVKKIATPPDRDFEGIPFIEVLKEE